MAPPLGSPLIAPLWFHRDRAEHFPQLKCGGGPLLRILLQALEHDRFQGLRHWDTGALGRRCRRHIEVRARPQFPDKIELLVRDNGPGLQGDPQEVLRPGVGLHNTMQRLEQLYGSAQRFEIGNARQGGFQVTMTCPLRRGEEIGELDLGASRPDPLQEPVRPRALG